MDKSFRNIFILITGVFLLLAGYSAVRVTLLFQAEDERSSGLIVSNHSRQLNDMQARMDSLRAEEVRLREIMGLPLLATDMWRFGTGGATPVMPENNVRDLPRLEQEILLLHSSLAEIGTFAENLQESWERIPSIRPVQGGYISSRFGYRSDPFTHRRAFHRGVDFRVMQGTPIMAPASGIVVQANRMRGFGRVIKLDHGDGIETVYAHLNKIKVIRGQRVVRGDVIGEVGSSGRSTSSHLHYEVRRHDKAVDPLDYIIDGLYVVD
jgi:murein DD-endopeptidase MepM/ murein hydrolase activator NlpD